MAARRVRPPGLHRSISRWLLADPRHGQLLVLASLLAWGVAALDLPIRPAALVLAPAVAVACQAVCGRLAGLPRFDPRSAVISSLSIVLLLRSTSLVPVFLAVGVAIASKFLIRARGRHVFNPSALGIVAALLLCDGAWVSAGQWGAEAWWGLLVGCAGLWVLHRACRSDVALAFLGATAALRIGRALWLGDPLAIPLHQLQTGSLLIFAFFMISDPRTTPDRRLARLLFGAAVALAAHLVAFGLWRENGPLWSLVLLSPLVPLLDRWLPGEPFAWPGAVGSPPRGRGRLLPAAAPHPAP